MSFGSLSAKSIITGDDAENAEELVEELPDITGTASA
jgi:hypothetical protein